jgi:Domain of unknown function (DUF4118)
MTDVKPDPQPDIIETADTDPLTPEWVRYLASIAMTAVATVVAIGVDSKVNIPNLSLVFVIPVIVAGVSLGLGPSLCAAILGALAFNFFLTEPRYSLAIDDPSNIWRSGRRLSQRDIVGRGARMRSEKSGAPSAAWAASLIRERRRNSSNGRVEFIRPER